MDLVSPPDKSVPIGTPGNVRWASSRQKQQSHYGVMSLCYSHCRLLATTSETSDSILLFLLRRHSLFVLFLVTNVGEKQYS